MKLVAAALVGWTVVAVAIVFFAGGVVNTPGCAHAVSASADCQAALTAENDAIFWSHTLPMVIAIVAGYVVVLIGATLRSRRSR